MMEEIQNDKPTKESMSKIYEEYKKNFEMTARPRMEKSGFFKCKSKVNENRGLLHIIPTGISLVMQAMFENNGGPFSLVTLVSFDEKATDVVYRQFVINIYREVQDWAARRDQDSPEEVEALAAVKRAEKKLAALKKEGKETDNKEVENLCQKSLEAASEKEHIYDYETGLSRMQEFVKQCGFKLDAQGNIENPDKVGWLAKLIIKEAITPTKIGDVIEEKLKQAFTSCK